MLDSETKNRINTARDILVGKVPDPKSQVEQITIALIYKFMDDMDVEAEELGGKRTFFVGEYAKYAWRKIFDPRQSGYELLNLYSEAIAKMDTNPGVPKLFRDIFKNAYLPYRDPETLKSFLKIINEFEYSHSEKLGDAFEFLLSILGSQGDAGQFRTPRHIIDFMVAIMDPKKHEVILDPACGTAGFLISSYKHIIKQNSSNYTPDKDQGIALNGTQSVNEVILTTNGYSGDKLTADERRILAENMHGYDISPDMVRLSLVNMYLHGVKEPQISEYDSLTSEDHWNEYSDVILANPPFMSPKGGIRPHKRFSVQSNRSEVLFVDYIAEHLTQNGRACIIVPEGIIFQSGNAYKQLRKMLVEKYLVGVISLPAGVFNPYSGVKTSILWLDKKLAKKTDKILFVKIENDGFDLGAQRRKINKNDLPSILTDIGFYKKRLIAEPFNVSSKSNHLIINKKQVSESPDYTLSGERYRLSSIVSKARHTFVNLGDVCSFHGGSQPPKEEFIYEQKDNYVRFIQIRDFASSDNITYIPVSSKNKYCEMDDVLIARYGASLGRICTGLKGAYNVALLKTSPDISKFNKRYFYYFLQSEKVQSYIAALGDRAAQAGVRPNDLSELKIPLPPLDIQERIVKEIESYQKIIDGARLVVENYKPRIEIDPEWEMVELGDIFDDLETGVSVNSESKIISNGEVGILKTSSVTYGVFRPEEHKTILPEEVQRAKCNPRKDSIIISRMNTENLVGASAYVEKNYDNLYLPDRLWQTIISKPDISARFIHLIISSDSYRKKISDICGGTSGSMKNISKKNFLTIAVPLPEIVVQNNIVFQIEKEQNIINANKDLIQMYEQKIKDRIAKVWGE